MPIQSTRKLFPIGQTFGVTIPIGWVRYYGLKAGDRVEMIAGEEIIIRRIDKRQQEGENKKD